MKTEQRHIGLTSLWHTRNFPASPQSRPAGNKRHPHAVDASTVPAGLPPLIWPRFLIALLCLWALVGGALTVVIWGLIL